MRNRIAVIGGGTSALYMLRAFVELNNPAYSLTIFEAGELMGVGMPYSPEWSNAEHDLNIASQELPHLLEEPHQWLARQSDEFLNQWNINRRDIHPLMILPRILFGRYQEEMFWELVQLGRTQGLEIDVHTQSRVTAIQDYSHCNSVVLTINNQSHFECDHIVISTGHYWPHDREGRVEGYFDSPYPLRKITEITNTRVGLIGSSLSAVDTIRTLARNNGSFSRSEDGELTYHLSPSCESFAVVMHSRRGLLPSVRYHLEHPRIRRYEYVSRVEIEENIRSNNGFLSLDYVFERSYMNTIREVDPDRYAEIEGLSLEEFVDYYYQQEGINHRQPFDFLAEQLAANRRTEQEQTPLYWKEAIEDTVYTLNFHAKSLSAEDTMRLRRYLMPLYYHAVIFMPYESTEELLALHRAGCLENVTLGYDSGITVSEDHPGGVFHFTNVSGERQELAYEVIVDCRGQRQLPFEVFPFSDLVERGVVSPARIRFERNCSQQLELPEGCAIEADGGEHYLRLPGLSINDSFQVINSEGRVNERIYLVANAHIKGMNPDLSGIPFCNDSAMIVMDSILN